jgi:amidophosphoribosyltransferase
MSGLFSVISKEDCVSDLFFGTDYHSHLGTRKGGLAVKNENGIKKVIHNIENTQFKSKFENDISKFRGNSGIGVISDYEAQPLVIKSHLGTFAIVTVGIINNSEELVKRKFSEKKNHFAAISGDEINPTELVAALISREDTFEDGIRYVHEIIEGSCSLILLTEKGIYAARDKLGRTPLVIGKREGAYAVASESCALPNLDFETERDLGPGEIVLITEDGIEQKQPPGEQMQICSFLWVYYGYPASSYEGINVEISRNKSGAALARVDKAAGDNIDYAAGIPDSGVGHAIGYAYEAGIPYIRPFVKYTPTWPRSFMPQDQKIRELVARMKLIPIKEMIKDKKVVFCDDSIVRGTQLRDTVQRLHEYGMKEVHMRPACPPLLYGCKFLNFSRSRSVMDLAGRWAIKALGDENPDLQEYSNSDSAKYNDMVEHIREKLDLTSLRYQKLENLVEAIGLPKEKLCTYCWDGAECPKKKESSVKEANTILA